MSWVIVEIATGRAIFETYNRSLADRINRKKYQALPALDYLQKLNERISNDRRPS